MARLTPDLILETSLDILQRYGLADLSIRKVAGTLGVRPGALYWHFPHKQALLGAVATYIVSSEISDTTAPPSLPSSWQTECAAIAFSLRDRLLYYRDGAEVVSAAYAARTCTLPQAEQLSHILSSQGLPAEELVHALIIFVVGSTVDEQTRSAVDHYTPDVDTPRMTGFHQTVFTHGVTALLGAFSVD